MQNAQLNLHSLPDSSPAGRICHALHNWKLITQGPSSSGRLSPINEQPATPGSVATAIPSGTSRANRIRRAIPEDAVSKSHRESTARARDGVSEPALCHPKVRRSLVGCIQSEIPQPACIDRVFQDGVTPSCRRSSPARLLHVQAGPQGCVPFCPHPPV